MDFKWDSKKAKVNLDKHGVSFEVRRIVCYLLSMFTKKTRAQFRSLVPVEPLKKKNIILRTFKGEIYA